MCKLKKVPFLWELGETLISLQVDSYYYSNSLAIRLLNDDEDGCGIFADMTVNMPGYCLEPNEAVLNDGLSKDLMKFIRRYKLGKRLPYTIRKGMGKYAVVAFDLDRLKEFDPEGVGRYKRLRGIS